MQDSNRFVTSTFSGCYRWRKLSCVCVMQFFIGFQYLNYGSIQDLSARFFDIDIDDVNWLYSVIMISSLPFLFIARYLFVRGPNCTHFLAVLLIAIGAWIRFLSAWYRNYPLAVASCVPMGASSAIWLTTLVPSVSRWFPENEQTLAIGLGLQSSYLGFICSGVIIPFVVNHPDHMVFMFLMQANVILLAAVLFTILSCYGRRQHSAYVYPKIKFDDIDWESGKRMPIKAPSTNADIIKMLLSNTLFLIQFSSFALLGGARYAVSGLQDGIFARFGYASSETAWTQAINVVAGAVSGVALGGIVKGRLGRAHAAIGICFVVGSLGLTGLAYIAGIEDTSFMDDTSRKQFFSLLLVVSGLLGGAGGGLQGLGMFSIAKCVHPLDEGYVVASLLFLQLGLAILFTSAFPPDTSMALAACLTWASTVALLSMYSRKPRTGIEHGIASGQ